jgi:hypothetical protein
MIVVTYTLKTGSKVASEMSVTTYKTKTQHWTRFLFTINITKSDRRKVKGKAVPLHTMEHREERRYSSYSLMTSALEGGEWSASSPGHTLHLGKGPTGQEAGWAPEPVQTQTLQEKSSCFCQGSNLKHLVVQSIIRRYTD